MKFSLFTRRASNEKVDKKKRYEQIKQILENSAVPMTAREISETMHKKRMIPTSERNFSAPRLTEMVGFGEVSEVGKKKCQYTGRFVTTYALVPKAE